MTRFSMLAAAVLSVLLTAACDKDKAMEEQNKANTAQNVATDKAAEANKEADQKIRNAQAEADKKIAEAQADFLKMREDYRHKTTTDLVDLNKKVEELDAKAKTANGKSKADLEAALKQIRSSRDAFAADYKSIETASATTWDATKVRLDKEWTDLKALVDKA
jgi:uncharacterized protein (DUF3084 family)